MRTLFAAPIALLFASSALAQAPAWHVSEMSGDVRIVENGQAHAAARGALVPAGAIVATGAGARAVIVRAHDYVIVSPASRVRVPTAPQQGASGLFQMITDAGTAMFQIEHQATPHFGVRTPYLAAVVKGTVFTVTVGEHGASVQVTQGAVQVSTVDGGAADMIRPGMVATISANDLQLLHVDGENSHDIRSNGTPSPGVATVPSAEAGHYDGPAETPVAVATPVAEDPVSLADATGGLVAGTSGGERAFAEVQVAARTDNHGAREVTGNSGNGNSGNGSGNSGSANSGNGNGNSGNGNGNGGSSGTSGNGNGNSGNGNGNGGGADTSGNGNGNSGNGNGNGGGSDTSGNGNGNSGNGNGNGGGSDTSGNGNGNSGNGNGNGGGSDTSGNGNGNSGNGNGNGGGADTSGNGNSGNGNNGNGGGNSGNGNSGNGNSGNSGGDGGLNVCVLGQLCVGVGNPHRPHP